MFGIPFSPTDIEELIALLQESLEAHRDPAVRAKLQRFIEILRTWLRRRPSWRQAWNVLGQILKWAHGGRPVYGVIQTASRMIMVLWDKTFLGLPLGGSAAALAATTVFLVAALAVLGYSIYKTASAPTLVHIAGPSCGVMPAATGLGPVSDWGVIANQKELFDNVMKQAQTQCAGFKAKCTGPCTAPATCQPNVSLQEFDISNYFVYRTVTFTKFNCTCECL